MHIIALNRRLEFWKHGYADMLFYTPNVSILHVYFNQKFRTYFHLAPCIWIYVNVNGWKISKHKSLTILYSIELGSLTHEEDVNMTHISRIW
jgi:hypothetical protein